MKKESGHKKPALTLTASEIGQFHFCSVAWYLQKCGYAPETTTFLEEGKRKHDALGFIIEKTQRKTKKANTFAMIGGMFLLLAAIVFIFERII